MHRLVVITGASRGIGATISIETSKKFNENTVFLLIARDQIKLDQVKEQINIQNPTNVVLTLSFDFSKIIKTAELAELLKSTLQSVDLKSLQELYVFYNHGTFLHGQVEQVADQVLDEFQINVANVWIFLAAIRSMYPVSLVPKQYHINISSLLASQPILSGSAYNSTRSARAMLFKCLALENPELRVLNYQPGPVYTDMLKSVYENSPKSDFTEQYEKGECLTAEQTVKRMWEIIDKNTFENGAAIDYFDSF